MSEQDEKRYVFVGNREYVLREMLRKDLNVVAVWVIENSFLHKVLRNERFVEFRVISSKEQLLHEISETEFDVLVSNGCKYVLPISKLKEASYINIHPSFLPDLRGKDPTIGAFLFARDCGATCHRMDDGIDTGKIIARVRIPMSDDIDAGLLFQLCFKAEVMAFQQAYQRHFEPEKEQPTRGGTIYYSMQPVDLLVRFEEGFDGVLRRAKAFGYKSKGLRFKCNGESFHFFSAHEIRNPFVTEYCKDLPDMRIAFAFEDSIIFKLEGRVMRFDQIEGLNSRIHEGDVVEPWTGEEIAEFEKNANHLQYSGGGSVVQKLSAEMCREHRETLIKFYYDNMKSSAYTSTYTRADAAAKIDGMISYIEAGQAIVYGCLLGDALIGYVWSYLYTFREEQRIYVSELHVLDEARRQGIGARLLREIEREARQRGIPAVYLHTEAHNEGAIRFYEREGYLLERVQMRKAVLEE